MLMKCCFTSTKTVGLLGTGAQDSHLDFHTAPELCRSECEAKVSNTSGANLFHCNEQINMAAEELKFETNNKILLSYKNKSIKYIRSQPFSIGNEQINMAAL